MAAERAVMVRKGLRGRILASVVLIARVSSGGMVISESRGLPDNVKSSTKQPRCGLLAMVVAAEGLLRVSQPMSILSRYTSSSAPARCLDRL